MYSNNNAGLHLAYVCLMTQHAHPLTMAYYMYCWTLDFDQINDELEQIACNPSKYLCELIY